MTAEQAMLELGKPSETVQMLLQFDITGKNPIFVLLCTAVCVITNIYTLVGDKISFSINGL